MECSNAIRPVAVPTESSVDIRSGACVRHAVNLELEVSVTSSAKLFKNIFIFLSPKDRIFFNQVVAPMIAEI